MKRIVWLPLALLLVVLAVAGQGSGFEKFEKMDLAKTRLKVADLAGLEMGDLRLLRGLVFGRHGRVFKEEDIQEYLNASKWYKRNPKFSNSVLNAAERSNLDLIRGAEADKRHTVEPGDLRFWETKLIKTEDLSEDATLNDVHVMKAEIEAIHGKRFPDEPALQAYFEDRYWYVPAAKYDSTTLSATEKKNLATLTELENKLRGSTLQPSDMEAFQNRLLKPEQLKGMGLYQLRLSRNWIYALHGYRFRTPWLREQFEALEWYKPTLPAGQEPKLNATDQRNVDTIVKVEAAYHEGLSKRLLKKEDLSGLFVEDLKKLENEIPARHGKMFADKWLDSYFRSTPWYKPNPAFKSSMLNSVEKKNQAFIEASLKKTKTQFDMEEG